MIVKDNDIFENGFVTLGVEWLETYNFPLGVPLFTILDVFQVVGIGVVNLAYAGVQTQESFFQQGTGLGCPFDFIEPADGYVSFLFLLQQSVE